MLTTSMQPETRAMKNVWTFLFSLSNLFIYSKSKQQQLSQSASEMSTFTSQVSKTPSFKIPDKLNGVFCCID